MKVRDGFTAADIEFNALGYSAAAIASYAEFEKLKVSFIRIFKNVEPGDEAEDIMEDREIIKETQVISQDEPVQSEAQAEPVQRKGIRRRRK